MVVWDIYRNFVQQTQTVMPKKIFKYPLVGYRNGIEMPAHATILSCGIQNDIPCIWCLVDTDKDVSLLRVDVFMTGDTVDADTLLHCSFIGTVTNSQGLVAHIFAQKQILCS